MPAVQVVNLTRDKPEPSGVEQFFSKLGKDYKDKEDQDKIGNLIKDYQQNREDANSWEDLQLNLQKSNISPTKRLEAQNELNATRKNIIEKDKTLNAQTKVMQDAAKAEMDRKESAEKIVREQKESETILLEAGFDPEQATAMSKNLTPVSARSVVDRRKEGDEYSKNREKSISEYVNTALEEGEAAESQKFAIAKAKKAVSGDITGPGWEAVAKHNPYTQLLFGLTPDEAALQAANKKLLEGSKGIFGARPTEREIFLLLNEMLPSIGKTKEANEAGIDFIEKVNDMKIAHSKIVDKLTNGGAKYVPDLQSQVNQQMKPLSDALLSEMQDAKKQLDAKEESGKDGKMKVKAPDGTFWNMTQDQIDAAKATKGVIFEPVK